MHAAEFKHGRLHAAGFAVVRRCLDFWIAGQPHESDSREWWKYRTVMVGDIPKRKGKGGRDGFLESRWKGMEWEGRAEL